MQHLIFATAAAVALQNTALADNQPAPGPVFPDRAIDEIMIIGSKKAAQELPGSGFVIDSEQMQIEAARDINQLLKTAPGMYILEEDGYGLRPNIGIRGATSERSSKITLLEDGVMIAPAPYSNPAAYYFPTTLRMEAIEIIKGAPLLRYGPQTTGGVVNLVSTPIPTENGGRLNLGIGENGEQNLLASYGGRAGTFGYLLETAQLRSEGFKDIDRSNKDSGYDISDYLVKLSWETDTQSLLLKAQRSDETSDETYLGLTDTDFDADPDRRYGLSEPDEMDNDHDGYSLLYTTQLDDTIGLSSLVYRNEFSRNWFKLSGGSAFIDDANNGDATAQGILDGTVDTSGLQYKNNARDYVSQGIELNVALDLGAHALNIGGRLHEDEMDRYQPVAIYDQIGGALVLTGTVLPTGSNNRFEEADALALWITDDWQFSDNLRINLALRREDVESSRTQYADPERAVVESVRSNDTTEWLPGASFTYDLNDTWQLLAGAHRGFSPLGGGAQESEDPETSDNYEAGVRYRGDWYAEAIGFYSDFSNKTENCSVADPCSNGATSGSFITGEARIAGIEFTAGTNLSLGRFEVPLDLMYTYTDAEISKDNPTEGFSKGDQLASVPENTFSLRVGLVSPGGWDNYAVAKYIDEQCVSIGCNTSSSAFSKTEDLWVVDVISRYELATDLVVFAKVENVLDEQVIISRQPDGARPNKPRTAGAGLEWRF